MDVGAQLRAMRKKAGLTQDAVADAMNVTRQTLSNWERGVNLPDIFTLARLATIYNVSFDEVFLGKTFFKGGQSVKTNYSDAQIENMIKKHYPDACEIRILSGGLVSQTFSFRSGMKKLIFQAGGKKEAYGKEHYVSQMYGHVLPMRIVNGIYENADGRAYCFSDYIEGSKLFDLSPQERIGIVPSILDLLDRIAAIQAPENSGYGRFDEKGVARLGSWREFISSVYCDELYDWRGFESKGLDIGVVRKAIAVMKNSVDCLDIGRPRLVHGDIGSYNLLAEGAQISGVIDWSLSLYGDPLYEAANVLFWNEDKLQPLVSALKERYLPDERNTKKLRCYMLRIGLEEIYNTAMLGEIGYDDVWVMGRLREITDGL